MHSTIGISTAVSTNKDPSLAAHELAKQLADPDIAFVLFFCSAHYNLAKLSYALNEIFPAVELTGCTTAGEITPFGYSRGSITAIGFSSEHFSIRARSISDLQRFALGDAQSLVTSMRQTCDPRLKESESFAITLVDGLSIDEEIFLATLNAALGSTKSFGGSAGDDVSLAKTYVFYNGAFHDNAAVVLMVTTDLPFKVFSTHHLQPTNTKLIVTETDNSSRCVTELNAVPASLAYAQSLSVELDQLDADRCTLNPLAVKLGDAYYIRSIQSIESDHSLKFFCAMETGLVLTKMEPTELYDNLLIEFKFLEESLGQPGLIIGCDCFLRRCEAELKGDASRISDLLQQNNVIGLNTYGEQLSGMHINQTFTGVAIGYPK